MDNQLTDEETIRCWLATHPTQCFDALYQRYVGKVYQQCLSMTSDAERAQDFTHDIFLKAFGKLAAFEERSRFGTWLYSIAYNYCADQLRLAKRLPTTSWQAQAKGHDRADEPDELLQEEAIKVIRLSMASLSIQDQRLLRLKYEDGLRVTELAQLYSLKPSAVKMRLKRSRQRLKSLFVQHWAA